jgi:benzoyl-CoA reductase subunit D
MSVHTVGIDVGSSSIKVAVMGFDGKAPVLGVCIVERLRKRDTRQVIREVFTRALRLSSLGRDDISYVASTGEGEMVDFRTGHFYSMTCHARGASFLNPSVRAVIDVGALHAKALVMDERSKVLGYRMTSQCASGSGQFLENIGRYLGVTLDDIGPLSLTADKPELPSGICAVLAETDVINMVSRAISTANILRGIHLSMARRLVTLLKMLKPTGAVLVTGGLARDEGLLRSLQELAEKDAMQVRILSHEHSILAGAVGAAIWGAFRHEKLKRDGERKCR